MQNTQYWVESKLVGLNLFVSAYDVLPIPVYPSLG